MSLAWRLLPRLSVRSTNGTPAEMLNGTRRQIAPNLLVQGFFFCSKALEDSRQFKIQVKCASLGKSEFSVESKPIRHVVGSCRGENIYFFHEVRGFNRNFVSQL